MELNISSNGHNHTISTPTLASILQSGIEFRVIERIKPTPRVTDSLDWFLASHLFIKPKPTERTTEIDVNKINLVEAENIAWLWEPYIALGKLTLLEGDPGIGKSFLTCALATAVSKGIGLPNMPETKPANVIMFTAEDGLSDTIRPRLERMNADLDRIYAVSQLISFDDKGLSQFEEVIAVYEPRLVIIDPLTVYMSKTDVHRSNCVQEVMSRLTAISVKFQCSLLCVRHLSKARGQRAINAGLGSIAFSGAVRSILLAGADPDDESKRAIVHTKSNLALKGESQGYAIDSQGFRWTGISNLTAERILLGVADVEGHQAKNDAVEFLREMLKDGPIAAKQIMDEAKQAGISIPTLKRAKKSISVESYRTGGVGKEGEWFWKLPDA